MSTDAVTLDVVLERDANKIGDLKLKVRQAKEAFDAAVRAYRTAVHYYEFEAEMYEWAEEYDRLGGNNYEPSPNEIEFYLEDHADNIEVKTT